MTVYYLVSYAVGRAYARSGRPIIRYITNDRTGDYSNSERNAFRYDSEHAAFDAVGAHNLTNWTITRVSAEVIASATKVEAK